MTTEPAWLPEMLTLSGAWDEMVTMLYGIFETDFKQGQPKFQNYEIWWDRRILPAQSYEEGFWHLISRDDKNSGERIPDFRRAERLPWCAPVIIHSNDQALNVWDYREGRGVIRTYIWLENQDYCVVLEKLRNSQITAAMLVTAFHVDGPSQRRRLQNKLARRVA